MTSRLKTIYVVWTFLMIMGVPGLSWGGSIAGNLTILRAPSGLMAIPMTTQSIFLSWTDNSGNESGFKIERSILPNSFFEEIATVGANTRHYTNGGLLSGIRYYYRVRAFNSSVHSSYSNSVSARTLILIVSPAAPSALGATTISASSIKLTWTDNSNNETGFKIERSLHENSGFEQIRTTAANTTSYTNTGLSASTTYYYRVRATNTRGDSAYTDVAYTSTPAAITIPSPPAGGLGAVAVSSTQINLAWMDSSNNETGFKIQRSTTSSSSGFSTINTTNAGVTSYSDSGLLPSTTYYYRVKATNSAGDSAYVSANATTEPPPAAGGKIVRIVNDFNTFTPASYGSTKNRIVAVRISETVAGLDDEDSEVLETRDSTCGTEHAYWIEPNRDFRDDTLEQLGEMAWPEDRADKWNLGYWDFEVDLPSYWVRFYIGNWFEEDPLDRTAGCNPMWVRTTIDVAPESIGLANGAGGVRAVDFEGMLVIKACDAMRPILNNADYNALCGD